MIKGSYPFRGLKTESSREDSKRESLKKAESIKSSLTFIYQIFI